MARSIDKEHAEAVVNGLRGFEVGDIVSDRQLFLRGGRVTQVDDDGRVNVYYANRAGLGCDGGHTIVEYAPGRALKCLSHD
jgi:hypothetical protein